MEMIDKLDVLHNRLNRYFNAKAELGVMKQCRECANIDAAIAKREEHLHNDGIAILTEYFIAPELCIEGINISRPECCVIVSNPDADYE
jgi:hypothetical protein